MNNSLVFLFSLTAFLFGVAVASYIYFAGWIAYALILLSLCLFCIVIIQRRLRLVVGACMLCFFALGILRFSASSHQSSDIVRIIDTHAVISGYVSEEPRIKNTQEVTVHITEVDGALISDPFVIRVTARPYPRYAVGDRVVLRGFIERPENNSDFDYVSYLAKDDIYAVVRYPLIEKKSTPASGVFIMLKRMLIKIKARFTESIQSLFPEPHSSYLSGLLIGDRSGIPNDLYDAFKATGTAHVVALSGFNISIIAVTLLFLFRIAGVPYFLSGILMSGCIILFSIMVGGEASIVRAAIMGIIAVLAGQSFRMYDAGRALLIAAFLMVFIEPKLLRFDIGFQLSCAATAGIIFLSPFIERRLSAVVTSPYIRGLLSATLAAEGAVTPILIMHFGFISLIAPVANLLILPTIPFAMLFGFLAASVGMISHALSFVFLPFAWILLAYEMTTVSVLSRLPFAYIGLSSVGQIIVLSVILSIGMRLIYQRVYYGKN